MATTPRARGGGKTGGKKKAADPFGDKEFVASKRATPATAEERARDVPHSEDAARRAADAARVAEMRPKAGRPTDYDPKEMPKQAEKLCLLGATDEEIADFFGVTVRTIYRWKLEHPEFCQALKVGKESADSRVERSLFQRAIGYRQTAVKIFMPAGAEEPVYADYIEQISPDTTAAIFWLKNRQPAQWRDKQEIEVTGNIAALLAERRKKRRD